MITLSLPPDIVINTAAPNPAGALLGLIGVLVGAIIAAGAQHFLARDEQVQAARLRAAEAAAAAQQYMVSIDHLTKQLVLDQQVTGLTAKSYNEAGAKAEELYTHGRQAVILLTASPDAELVAEARKLHDVMVEMTNSLIPALRRGDFLGARKEFDTRRDSLNIALNMILTMVTSTRRLKLPLQGKVFKSSEQARQQLHDEGKKRVLSLNEDINPLLVFLETRLGERLEAFDAELKTAEEGPLRQELLEMQRSYQSQHDALWHLAIMHRPLETRTGAGKVLRLLTLPYSGHSDFREEWKR